ncbi:unnamed protein product [Menidia menidia]|uniref:(Atlantic silverside) hypothetical protein n=1 Tax=Menidia menidia TaxID=238744 RepID=A0A8S4BBM9_9TELE|nr:unnamed protein product [Menidia menidia]
MPLPDEKFLKWQRWQESLQELNQLNIPCTYASFPVTTAECTELCVFSDASVKAIAAVAYLRVEDENGHTEVSFVLGKAKLAPLAELTIPRLELCAAVLATEIADQVKEELGQALGKITFFTDKRSNSFRDHSRRARHHQNCACLLLSIAYDDDAHFCPYFRSSAMEELAIQHLLRDSGTGHPDNMPLPPQLVSSYRSLYALATCPLKDFRLRYPITPGYA